MNSLQGASCSYRVANSYTWMHGARRSRSGKMHISAAAALAAGQALKVHTTEQLGDTDIKQLLARPRIDFSSIFSTVSGSPGSSKGLKRRIAIVQFSLLPATVKNA
jgi:hypothetical protein